MKRNRSQIEKIKSLLMMRVKIQPQENKQEKRWLRKHNSLMHLGKREETLKKALR